MPSEYDDLLSRGSTFAVSNSQQRKIAEGSVYALSILRAIVGASLFIAPQFSANLAYLPFPTQANMLAQLVGIRDFMIGGYLFSLRGGLRDPSQRAELRRFLILNIVTDALDSGTLLYYAFRGVAGPVGTAIFACAAGLFIAMGASAFKALGRSDYD